MPNRAQRNNNPGNLRYAGQKEAIGKDDRGFAVFPTPWAGWRALLAQIKLDQRRGLTLERFIEKYAPPDENDTRAYVEFVCRELAVSPLVFLADLSAYAVAAIMAAQEGYFAKEG
jgi:hypothetical protein